MYGIISKLPCFRQHDGLDVSLKWSMHNQSGTPHGTILFPLGHIKLVIAEHLAPLVILGDMAGISGEASSKAAVLQPGPQRLS